MNLKKNNSDVIIIGLGAMGSASSYYLSKEGVDVIGFDTYKPPHSIGSSHGETRIIREAYHEGTSYVPIVKRAYDLWEDMNKESGENLISQFGGIILGNNGDHIKKALKSAEKYNIPIDQLNSSQIKDQFPVLNPPLNFTGLYEKRSGAVFPEKSISFMHQQAKKNGARLFYDEKVLGWKRKSNSFQVETNKGTYLTQKLILSSGAWIKNLVPDLNLPIKIERQVLFWLEPKKNKDLFQTEFLPNTGWDLDSGHEFYTQPMMENKGFKVAKHHDGEFILPENLDRETKEEDIVTIRSFLEEYIPDANGKILDSKVCIYTDTPDLDFILDFSPVDENIIICSPCSGHGFKFTPAIGEICTKMIKEEKIPFDLSEFSISRFQNT